MPVQPEIAAVRPRVFSPYTGQTVPLEDVIADAIARGVHGSIWLIGPPGAGKTAALRHLAAVLTPGSTVHFHDDCNERLPAAADALTICTSRTGAPFGEHTYRLAPWSNDDVLEYVLTRHREKCLTIMSRLRAAADRHLASDNPELWRTAIDEMAGDESVLDIASSWRALVAATARDPDTRKSLQLYCLYLQKGQHASAEDVANSLRAAAGVKERLFLLARHHAVQVVLVADYIAAELAGRGPCSQLQWVLPRDLVREIATVIRTQPCALERLKELAANAGHKSIPMAASVLLALNPAWVPEPHWTRIYSAAYLDRACWPGIDLKGADLVKADLSHANLEGARLDSAQAREADFRFAVLRGAWLPGIKAQGANISGADLRQAFAEKAVFTGAILEAANLEAANLSMAHFAKANLTQTKLIRANLMGANLSWATIDAADFTAATLEGACLNGLKLNTANFPHALFANALLCGCDLEFMELPGADFHGANLEGAHLTGSVMRKADFAGACLRQAGLADIDWEGANLRDADLSQASFHLGSSRSGLVGIPIASEGSRTGFYTDDYVEQDFKSPEEIRKANLCGADLRGAKIDDTDFYLVDLRNALYDVRQERHFRRSGAILKARVRP